MMMIAAVMIAMIAAMLMTRNDLSMGQTECMSLRLNEKVRPRIFQKVVKEDA